MCPLQSTIESVASKGKPYPFTVPLACVVSLQDQGADDTLDNDVNPVTASTALIAYTVGTANRTVDAALTSKIFADGFESGDTTIWSSTVP